MVASLSSVNYFLPIFAFLFVFIVIYALLKKTEVLGDSEPVLLFVSFILSSFFIVEARLVDFVLINSSWFAVGAVLIFFIIALVGFWPGEKDAPLKFLTESAGWFRWIIFGVILAFFIISSSYIFNWVLNWSLIWDWVHSDWFGMVLLLVIAGIVSWTITKK
jgi:hypothetical protein